MADLPDDLVIEKNRIASKSAPVWLLQAEISDELVYRFAHWPSNITWCGYTWLRSSFSVSGLAQNNTGKKPNITVGIANVDRVVQGEVEAYDGMLDTRVTVYMVSYEHLDLDTPMLETVLDVSETVCTPEAVIFTLGAENFYLRQFPSDVLMADVCRWWKNGQFKGARCLYAGAETECDGTFNRCLQLANQSRYGGAPGLARMGFSVDAAA